MIRYPISLAELQARVRELEPAWLSRAGKRIAKFARIGRYEEESSIWSEIKPVYMALQHNKCAYCERRLEGPDVAPREEGRSNGRVEHDMEHFRPKARVDAWPDPNNPDHATLSYEFPTGGASNQGYPRLAYHLLNYAATCKTCNTELKANYFPIESDRIADGDQPRDYESEQPLLIYPIGDIDDDPEDLLTFVGVLPIPKSKDEHRARRARVTIDLLQLAKRDSLRSERAKIIGGLYFALEWVNDATRAVEERTSAEKLIVAATRPAAPHCACARAFAVLYEVNYDRAREIWEYVVDIL